MRIAQRTGVYSLFFGLLLPLASIAVADPIKAPGSVTTQSPDSLSPETKASNEQSGASSEATTKTEMTQGEIRKIDKATHKVTIKHAEIKNLDMPPMTMVFQVKDLSALESLNVGDQVRFTAEKATSGGYVVTSIVRGK